jgi:hypothetical protein
MIELFKIHHTKAITRLEQYNEVPHVYDSIDTLIK